MVRRASPWLLASVLLSACGEPPPPPPPPPGVVAPNARPAAATTPSGQPGQPTVTPTIDSNFGTVTLATGFQPDPHVERGTSGGDIDARTFQGDCRGFVTQKPDHVLVATTAFQRLRILVNAGEADVTLVVQAPGGAIRAATTPKAAIRSSSSGAPRAPTASGSAATRRVSSLRT